MVDKPLLSIVVTSYANERLRDIYELLDSIKAQTYPNIEAIFVVERSMELLDKVKAYASEKNIYDLKVIFNYGEPGLSMARNLGIKEARGDIIAFIDDDALPFPNWAEETVKTYEDDSIIGVTGPAFPLWEDESMAWLPEEFYWIISCTAWCDWSGLTKVRNVWGMNMSFRREAFERCGLFSATFGLKEGKGALAEEDDLSIRVRREMGKSIVYNPKVKIRHKVYKYRLTWNFVARRSYQIGRSRRILSKLHSKVDNSTYSLKIEEELLKRIFRRLLPTILSGFFKNPLSAWRKFSVTVVALFCVALGYSLKL